MYLIACREGVKMDFMDIHTGESIGIDYILNIIAPKSPYGMDGKRKMKPYLKGEELMLQEELDNIENLIALIEKYPVEFSEMEFMLGNFKEIRTSLKRVENGIPLDSVELFEIKNFIFSIKDINVVQNRISSIPDKLKLWRNSEMEELFDPEGTENRTFYVYDCYS
jgi:hypothetical protein